MKRYCFLILLIISKLSVFAQDSLRDSAEIKKTSLTLATIYSSDASYYGQRSSERLPYVLGYASVKYPTGIYLAGALYKLINIGSGVSGANLTVGYDFDLSRHLSGGLNFSHSFYPDNSLFLQSANSNTASASLGLDLKAFKMGVIADYAISDTSALYLTINASRSIDLGNLFSEKDYISFEPGIEVVAGTQNFPARTEESRTGPLGLKKVKKQIPARTAFNLLTYNLKLPIAYNRANYTLEASYQGTILSKNIEGASQKPLSLISLGFYYMF